MSNIIATSGAPGDFEDIGSLERRAQHLLASGWFKDLRSVSQAIVKILKGRELGIGEFTACDQINMINGKPTLNAGLVAALIRKSKDYDYEVIEKTNTSCSIQIIRKGKPLNPIETFTIEDAKRAGLTRNATYTAYPMNMLFARCISNAARFFCPEVLCGVYVPEDFPDAVENTGKYIAPQILQITQIAQTSAEQLLKDTNTTLEDLNTALGTNFSTAQEIEVEPFVISFLKSKKETMS